MAHMNGVKSGPLSVRNPWGATIVGGLVGGALDIAFAVVLFSVSAERVFQSVAAGLLGRDAAVAGGLETAMIGAGAHFFISIIAAGIYVLATTPFPVLLRQFVLGGFTFGVCVWAVMNFVVVPNSMAKAAPIAWPATAIMIGGHMLFFGLPIAWVSRAFAGRK